MGAWVRIVGALAIALLLAGCLLTPGQFTSRLTINADRSFTFAYTGEVYARDPDTSLASTGTDKAKSDELAKKKAEAETKNRAIADALSKEAGYRSVQYVGGGKFLIDYQASGRLDHNFVYPFNLDAQAIVPFVAIELRANGTVRMKAPGFSDDSKNQAGPVSGMANTGGSQMRGTFTLDTDAEIVSQNSEEGPVASGTRRTIVWNVTPLTKDTPTAVLRLR